MVLCIKSKVMQNYEIMLGIKYIVWGPLSLVICTIIPSAGYFCAWIILREYLKIITKVKIDINKKVAVYSLEATVFSSILLKIWKNPGNLTKLFEVSSIISRQSHDNLNKVLDHLVPHHLKSKNLGSLFPPPLNWIFGSPHLLPCNFINIVS